MEILRNKLALLKQKKDVIFDIYYNLDNEERLVKGEHYRRMYYPDFKVGDSVKVFNKGEKTRLGKIVNFIGYLDDDDDYFSGYVGIIFYNGRKLNKSINHCFRCTLEHFEFPTKKRKMKRI
jgi:hypothetical protein